MKVNGFDVDIGVEGVLVEENRASSVMGHVEPISKNVMIDILRCYATCLRFASQRHLPFHVEVLDSSCIQTKRRANNTSYPRIRNHRRCKSASTENCCLDTPSFQKLSLVITNHARRTSPTFLHHEINSVSIDLGIFNSAQTATRWR